MYDHFLFESLSLPACIKFISCLYLYYDKHKTVFGNQSVYNLAVSLYEAPIPHETAIILQWLGHAFSQDKKIATVRDWADLVRPLAFMTVVGDSIMKKL